MPIKLLIVDEHEIVRAGVRSMVSGTEIKVVAEADSGDAAIRLTLNKNPDVVTLGIRLPSSDGLKTLGRIRQKRRRQPVLIFSSFDNPIYVARALALDANGYLLKRTTTRDQLVGAIRTSATGASAWTRHQLRRMTGALSTPRLSADVDVPLTEREHDVLRQMAKGLTNEEIADVLDVGYETVKEHVQHILHKAGVEDRTQAAVWAVRKKLV